MSSQDPYHGSKQANGLCFSVNKGIKVPPSLVNIFEEIKNDVGIDNKGDGDLTKLAEQGILLLNSCLTVEEKKPASHSHFGWQYLTDAIIQKVSEKKRNCVFLLFGNFAKEKSKFIDGKLHLISTSAHPSPYSANSGFFGSKHFSKTNKYLKLNGRKEIDWSI